MEFDPARTAAAFLVLLGVLLAGVVTSGMPANVTVPVAAALIVFSVLFLVLGVKHGEYRAIHERQ